MNDLIKQMLKDPGPWLYDLLMEMGYPSETDLQDLLGRLEPVEEGEKGWKVRRKARERALRHLSNWTEKRLAK